MKKRGIILLCTLVIMIILTMFLMVSVYKMQSSSMVNKMAMLNIKSYWAAEAGNNIAADCCILSKDFPNDSNLPFNNGITNYGGYNITIANNIVKGEDESSASSFTINYKNHLTNTTIIASNGLSTSLGNHFTLTNPANDEIYCLTVGKSGVAECGTDFIYKRNPVPNISLNDNITKETITHQQATFLGAALYVSGDLDVQVKNYFTITEKDNTKGCIVAGGKVSIKSVNHPDTPTWIQPGGLCMGDGSIFVGGRTSFPDGSTCKINEKGIPIGDPSNFANFGVSVYQKPTGNNFQSLQHPPYVNQFGFKQLDNVVNLPCGIWSFMEMPSHTTAGVPLSGLRENEFRALCEAVDTICPDNNETDDTTAISIFESYLNRNPNYSTWFDWSRYNDTNGNLSDKHKAYIASKFNQVFSKLNTLDGKYVPIFLPEHSFGTRAKLSPKSIKSITYSGVMKALVSGVISENKMESETLNDIGNAYTIDTLQDKAHKDFYLLRPNNNTTIKTDTATVGQHISFSAPTDFNQYLTMQIEGNLESTSYDSFFSFVVLERNPVNLDDLYKQYLQSAGEYDSDIDETEIYSDADLNELLQQAEYFVPANDRRGRVQLGNGTTDDNSIVADKMHIKGSIIGRGCLRSKVKDVTFEGVGSGVTSDGLVSIWSTDDIKIYQTSAANSTNFTSESELNAKFRGILYAYDKVLINVGTDDLNFDLSGAIVTTKTEKTTSGFMEVKGIKNFTLTYDPDILGNVLGKYINGWQTILEEGGGGTGGGSTTPNHSTVVPIGTFKAFNRI